MIIAALIAAIILLTAVGAAALGYQNENAWLYQQLGQAKSEVHDLRMSLVSMQKQINQDVADAIRSGYRPSPPTPTSLDQADRDAFDAITAHWEDPR
jgi:hypothetical protein